MTGKRRDICHCGNYLQIHFAVNGKPVTESLALGEGVTFNIIFSWPFLQKIKYLITNEINALVCGLLGEKFRLNMMVTQKSKEAPKTTEGPTVSLPVSIQGKQYNTKERGSRNSRVELNRAIIHQL